MVDQLVEWWILGKIEKMVSEFVRYSHEKFPFPEIGHSFDHSA